MNQVQIDNGTIYYEQEGEGIPIIFIHPPGMGRRVFDNQKRLRQYFQIITPDLSGHGASTSRLAEDIVSMYVEEIRKILKHEAIGKAVIFGYSAGGVIAQSFSIKYPEMTSALILSGGYPIVKSIGLHLEYNLGMRLFELNSEALARILAISHSNDQAYREILFDHMRQSNHHYWYQFYLQTLHFNCVEKLPMIKVPILLLYGGNAHWIHFHKRYYKVCPDVKIAMIGNAFHQLPTKEWRVVNHLVKKFIEERIAQ